MTRLARSGSQHNKNHMDKTTHNQPCLPLPSSLVTTTPACFPCSQPLQPSGREASSEPSHAPYNLLRQARGSHRVPREPMLCLIIPALPAVSLFNLSGPICSTSWGGRTFRPPAESVHSLSLSTYSDASPIQALEDYSLVFSSYDPVDCAAGPSSDFHNFIPGIAAMISRTVEHIFDHRVGFLLFPSDIVAILLTIRSTPDRPDKKGTLHTPFLAPSWTQACRHFVTLSSP